MRRKKRAQSAPTIRLSEEVMDFVNRLASTTGWSPSQALTFLVNVGWNAGVDKGDKIGGYRKLLDAAVDHHEAEENARKKLAATAMKLREARKALAPAKGRR